MRSGGHRPCQKGADRMTHKAQLPSEAMLVATYRAGYAVAFGTNAYIEVVVRRPTLPLVKSNRYNK